MLNIPTNAPPSYHVLAKPTGAICNLDCEYCFFLSKEMLYPGSRFRMAEELLEIYIRQLLESQQMPEVTIGWQGGEPTLMGLDFFKLSVEYANKYKKPNQRLQHTIQTNGTKLDDVVLGLSVNEVKGKKGNKFCMVNFDYLDAEGNIIPEPPWVGSITAKDDDIRF